MNVRLTCLAIAVAAVGSLFGGKAAVAQPNCPTCLKAYYACEASGRTDCDTTYATCLQFCPLASVSAPTPIKQDKPQERVADNKRDVALLAAR